jgi:DNA polymerase-3 subunit alpha
MPVSLKLAEQHVAASRSGQTNLFGGAAAPAAVSAVPLETLQDLSDAERLTGERETLGLFLTGHPIEEFADDLAALTNGTLRKMKSGRPASGIDAHRSRRTVRAAGLVVDIRRRGKRVTLVLDDRTDRLEVMLFDELYQQCRNIIARDAVLIIEGTLRFDEFIDDWRLTAKKITDIDDERARHAGRLVIRWQQPEDGQDAGQQFVESLKSALHPFRRGSCDVQLRYIGGNARASVALGEDWRVRPTRELMNKLADLVGRDSVRLVYPPRTASTEKSGMAEA